MKNTLKKFSKSTAVVALMALVLSPLGLLATQTASVANAAEGTATVTILKYIDGAQATAITASSSDFQMNATYTIGGTPGTGQYTLSAAGYNGDPTPYQAITSALPFGSDYETSEIMGSVVGPAGATSTPFTLAGYTSGDTLAQAAAATHTTEAPSVTGITSDKFFIVWNNTVVTPPATTTATSSPFVVTNTATGITSTDATLNGTNGTSDASGHSIWVSTSTFNTASPSIPAGVYSTVDLGPIASSTAFSALLSSATGLPTITPNTTYYFAAWSNVGGTWYPGDVHSFTTEATNTGGSIGGDVTGGVSTSTTGILKVDSITAEKTTAIADGTFTNGWRYVFNVTVPTNETHLSMKFSDWASVIGSTTLPVANNMRISSVQADNGNATVTVTAANTYTLPALNMTGDLSTSTVGNQVQITVEVAVPSTTVNGSYTTNYGIKTQ